MRKLYEVGCRWDAGLACSHEYNSGLEPKAEYNDYDIAEADPDARVTQWDLKGERSLFLSLCSTARSRQQPQSRSQFRIDVLLPCRA